MEIIGAIIFLIIFGPVILYVLVNAIIGILIFGGIVVIIMTVLSALT